MHAYPKDLAMLVRRRWNTRFEGHTFFDLPVYEAADALPGPVKLGELLSICYQASLLREEGRPVRFRLLLCNPKDLANRRHPSSGLELLPFARPLRLAPNELRRLAAAAAFERALIGAQIKSNGQLRIWGLVHSGDQWMRALEGSRRGVEPLPPCLVVSVTGSGNLSVAKGSLVVARLLGGQLVTPASSVLEVTTSEQERESINQFFLTAHARNRRRRGRQWGQVDAALISQLRRQIASRIISAMRQLHHGGILLILPLAGNAPRQRWQAMLNIKYAFPPGKPRRRLFELLLWLLEALAEETGRRFGPQHRVTWTDYLSSTDAVVHQADEAITEGVRFLACLSAVDGAVVIQQPLELIGFGAEISGRLPPVAQVARALNPTATRTRLESTLDVGTRHRSAYRICQALPGAVAVVVSQDGSIRIMKRTGERVIYSEHLGTGALDS